MAEKDSFEIQTNRIKQTVHILCPACVVFFDDDRAPHGIRFRIEDGMGTILTSAHPDYHVSEVADWSEEKLEQMIEFLTAGRVSKRK
jgi:hypothetical protein